MMRSRRRARRNSRLLSRERAAKKRRKEHENEKGRGERVVVLCSRRGGSGKWKGERAEDWRLPFPWAGNLKLGILDQGTPGRDFRSGTGELENWTDWSVERCSDQVRSPERTEPTWLV
eukprot:scaffold47_cov258-Pinguiococcus_pyrenoidosus.AAC.46